MSKRLKLARGDLRVPVRVLRIPSPMKMLQAALKPAENALRASPDPETLARNRKRLTRGQENALRCITLLGIVDNGGMEYYLTNGFSWDIEGDVRALRGIGASKYARLMAQAKRAFPANLKK